MHLVGVDVGGTFTDFVYTDTDTDSGRTEIHKVATTTDDPSRGIRDGVRALCERFSIDARDVEHLFHGTTIATNAILQHDGAVTGPAIIVQRDSTTVVPPGSEVVSNAAGHLLIRVGDRS